MDIEKLREIPLFADLHDHTLRRIAELSTEFEEPAGWVLVEVGQPGSGMFVLEEGTVEVQTPDGRAWELGAGEFFGELALLTDHPRNARIRAKTPGALPRDIADGLPASCSRKSRTSRWRCCRSSPSASTRPTEPGLAPIEHTFYPVRPWTSSSRSRRKTFDTPEFRGITFIESEAKSIINRVPGGALPFDWTINPYRGCSHACTYCFARPTHTYLDMNAGRDFETKIVVKVNAPDVLRRELAAKRWKGEHIAMGTATDPYQRAEGRYKLMRGIMEALIDHRNPFSILTKGTLILRDLDLLQRGAEVAPVSAAFSIGTLDEQVWRATEPGTPHPRARIEAIRTLTEGGIPTGVLMAPILPGISDRPDQLREVVGAAIDAGATHVSPILLHLRPGVREEFLPWLEEEHPDLVERYLQMYRQPYGPKAYPRAARPAGVVDGRGRRRSSPRRRAGAKVLPPRSRSPSGTNARAAEDALTLPTPARRRRLRPRAGAASRRGSWT